MQHASNGVENRGVDHVKRDEAILHVTLWLVKGAGFYSVTDDVQCVSCVNCWAKRLPVVL